jgi:hypothetical protein
VSRILTLHPLAAPVDHAAHHRASDRLAATVPDSTGHTAWPVGTGPGPDGVMPGGSESWYRDSLAKRLAKGDLWARLEAAGARYEIGGDSETATADVYLPPGCEALADEVRAWGRRMGAEARDAGAWLRDALETTSGTPVYPTTIPRSEVTISVPVTPGPVVYGELIDGVFVSDTDLFVAEERKRAAERATARAPSRWLATGYTLREADVDTVTVEFHNHDRVRYAGPFKADGRDLTIEAETVSLDGFDPPPESVNDGTYPLHLAAHHIRAHVAWAIPWPAPR